MATRMQQRRGTAAQWISTNSGNGPILAAGEIGYESDTNKFKIGDGTNHWLSLDYFMDADSTTNPQFGSNIKFEGATANAFETTLAVVDPTADRTITLPDATGTVVLADSSTGAVTISGDLTVSGTTTTINSTTINATTGLVFEGSTADAYETTISVVDPTADRAIEFPNVSGTVVTTGNLSAALGATATELGYLSGVTSAIQTQLSNKQAVVTDVSDTEIGYLNGVTSAIQTQLNNKQAIVANVSDEEIGHLNGVTSSIQTQLGAKAPLEAPTFTGTVTLPSTTSIGDVSSTEIGYVNGVTSAIQTQMDAKAPLASPTFTGTVTLPSGTVTSAMIFDGTIATADIADSAITSAKIADGTIVAGDLADGAVTSAKILDGTIVDADINASAAIDWTKLGISSTVSSTEIGYVDGVTSAIQTQLDAKAALSGATFTGAVSGTSLTLSGDLTVNGTTTNINSTSLVVEDKNVVLGDVETPTDTTADGGGITLKGATDKTFNWVDATDSWTSSENINLASGKDLKVNGTSVLSTTAGGFIFTDGTQTKEGVPSRTTIVQKTASYNLSTDGLTLRDNLIEISSASGTTLTIPLNSTTAFPIGTSIDILQTNTGQVTIAGAVGVTVNSTPGLKLRGQWSSATLFKRAENTWVVMGDLSA
jgi:hypothetical protein